MAEGAADAAGTADAVEALKALHPKAYHTGFLSHGVHADARSIRAARPTTLAPGGIGSAAGSAIARIGRTTVLTGIKCEVGMPREATPKAGRIEVGVHLTPLCSSQFPIGAPVSESFALAQFLSRTITGARLVDLDSLCIAEGESVWVLRADVVCLDYAGNVADAALLSLVGALQNLQLPETQFDESGIGEGRRRRVVVDPTAPARPLELSTFIVPLSFVTIDGIIVPDPTVEEEEISSSTFTVVRTSGGDVCEVYKPGGAAIDPSDLAKCVQLCKQRVEQLEPLFEACRGTL